MAWQLTHGLQNLRNQVNARWPNRDKLSDGSIGDLAHQQSTSGHNPDDTPGANPAWSGDPDTLQEVRAWDCDVDFREPGIDPQAVVDHICALPHVSTVLRYIIYNRRIYHERTGFQGGYYGGANAHTHHIHFEGAWSQAADSNRTFDFRLDEVGTVPLGSDNIAITRDTAAAIDKKEGEKVPASILLQLAVIHAARGNTKAGQALNQIAALDGRLSRVETWLDTIAGPDPETVAEALRAVLGKRAPEIGLLLAQTGKK